MLDKIKKRCTIVLLLFSLCFSCSSFPIYATSLQKAKDNKKTLETNKKEVEKQVKQLQKKQKKLEESVKKLDEKTETLDVRLDKLNTQLGNKRNTLAQTKVQLAEAKTQEEKQYVAMKKRIKYMYESGDNGYFDIIFQAKSIADLLNRTEYVSKITEYDNTMLQRLKSTRAKIAKTEEKLEKEVQEVKELKQKVQAERKKLVALVKEKKHQLSEYEKSIAKQKELVTAYEQEIAKQEQLIVKLEEEGRAQYDSNISTASSSNISVGTDSGNFTWPCPSSHTVTSPFGYRVHPILKTKRLHSGIDIGASHGSSIVAAGSGTVIAAAYSSSMGNYVMISHGNGITTVYMHCSSLLVHSGQKVTRGQQIARVGSTGLSTGPHLHFSVMKNGSYVNPWGYL